MTSPTDKYAGATPGPWVVHDIAPDDIEWASRFEIWSDNESVPEESEDGIPCNRLIASHVNGEANAMLIADSWTLAAENAELRAAINRLLNCSECYCPEQFTTPPCGYCVARAVIMKVEGQ